MVGPTIFIDIIFFLLIFFSVLFRNGKVLNFNCGYLFFNWLYIMHFWKLQFANGFLKCTLLARQHFFVLLFWHNLQLDMRAPALYLMGALDCHCPLTKQGYSINLGNPENQTPGCRVQSAHATSVLWSLFIVVTLNVCQAEDVSHRIGNDFVPLSAHHLKSSKAINPISIISFM